MERTYKSVSAGCIQLQEKLGTYKEQRTLIYKEKESEIKEILAECPAREDIEKMLDAKVFLDLYVRVKENWRDSEFTIKNLGYTEER